MANQKSAIREAKDGMFADTATGDNLSALWQNYGIPRPPVDPTNDPMYTQIGQAIAWQPKTILRTCYALLEAIFGSQASLIQQGLRPWRVYEVNANEIILEVPMGLTATGPETASYLHGYAGPVVLANTASAFSVAGNAPANAATSLVGNTLLVYRASVEAWESSTIATISYNATLDRTDITLSSPLSFTPVLGDRVMIDIPGDNVASHRGDYLAPDAEEAADTDTTPPHDDRVYLSGEGKIETFQFYMDLLVRAAGVTLRVERI